MRLPTLGYSLGTSCLISLHSGHSLNQSKSSAQTWQGPDKTISLPLFAVNFRPYYVPLQITCSISQIHWNQLVHRGVPQNDVCFRVCFGVSFAKSNLPAILKVEYSFSIPTRILMINAILYQHTIIYYKLYIQYLFNVIECLWLLLVPTSSFQPRSHCNFGTSRIRSTPITWGTWWRPWHSHQVSKEPNQG